MFKIAYFFRGMHLEVFSWDIPAIASIIASMVTVNEICQINNHPLKFLDIHLYADDGHEIDLAYIIEGA